MGNCLSSSLKNSSLLSSLLNQKDKLNKTLFELETFFDTSRILQANEGDKQLYEDLLFRAISLMNSSGGILFLKQKESPICTVAAILHSNEEKIKAELFTENFKPFKSCEETKSIVLLNNFSDKKLKVTGWKHALVTPLNGPKEVHGYLILGEKESRDGIMPFSEEDAQLMEVISLQAGIALENRLLIQNLDKEKKSVNNIIRSIGNGIITLNLLGEIDSYNNQALEILEKSDDEVTNHPYFYVFENMPRIIDLITKCIDTGKSIIEPNMVIPINDNEKNINFTARPLIDSNLDPIGVIIGIENITEELRVRNTFKRYVSESIVDQIVDDNLDLGMGGQLKDVTVLFSDIRGFTAMSEKMEPDDVVKLLNEYYTIMIDIIFKYNGTLDKIVGDELMVVFGAPVEIKNPSDAAINTAIEMQNTLIEINKESSKQIEIGIGINSGFVISGNIGSEVRSDYTVIGDNVNLASRLCSYAKGHEIIISKNTSDNTTHNFNLKKLPPFEVKGKQKKINAWKVQYG